MRFGPFATCLALTAAFGALGASGLLSSPWCWLGFAVFGLLSLVGVFDLMQREHSLTRNYPVLGHLRFLFESARPEVHQYFVESNTDGRPFNRDQRSLIYQRAKDAPGLKPFGTELDVYDPRYTWLLHSLDPKPKAATLPRITVGGTHATRPYSASLLNVSAMSFGALSARAVQALNLGAKLGGFYQTTGEGGCSRYHLAQGGDLVFQFGTGYFGCRDAEGRFSAERFAEVAADERVKMIELKLSQGAKPGHGGVLPAAKVSREIAEARGVPMGEDCLSPITHSAFSTPRELCLFLQRLRELSGGKPVGFKLCVGHHADFLGLCKAMRETGLAPDYIVVDGGEGGTGAAPLEFSNAVGTPLLDALFFVHQALIGTGLRDRVRIAASGKLYSAATAAMALALGADWCNAARPFLMAIGCLQTQRCHTNRCPVGIATQDPLLQRAIDIEGKARRAERFHEHTVDTLSELTAAAGLTHPSEFTPYHFCARGPTRAAVSLADTLTFLAPGELLEGTSHTTWRRWWAQASAERFERGARAEARRG